MRNQLIVVALALTLAASACRDPSPQPTAVSLLTDAVGGVAEDHAETNQSVDDTEVDPGQIEDFAGLTDAQADYLNQTQDIAEWYAVRSGQLNDHIDLVVADATSFDDETWKAESEETLANTLANILASIYRLNQEVRDLELPDDLEGLRSLVEAAEYYESFVALYAKGIGERQTDKIDQAIEEMVAGSRVMWEASEGVGELIR